MIARRVRRHLEKFPNHREIRVHHFEPGGQCIFERNIVLQFSRLHPVGDEQLIASLNGAFFSPVRFTSVRFFTTRSTRKPRSTRSVSRSGVEYSACIKNVSAVLFRPFIKSCLSILRSSHATAR